MSASPLADNEEALVGELMGGHFQVKGRRSLTDSARGIVMGAVAWAIIASPVTSVRDGHTTQMRADANDHQPLGLDHTLLKKIIGIYLCLSFRILPFLIERVELYECYNSAHSYDTYIIRFRSRSEDVGTWRSVSISDAVR